MGIHGSIGGFECPHCDEYQSVDISEWDEGDFFSNGEIPINKLGDLHIGTEHSCGDCHGNYKLSIDGPHSVNAIAT